MKTRTRNVKQAMRFLAILLGILMLGSVCAFGEETLNDEDLTDMLYALNRENERASDFLVLPDDYREPVTGLSGVYSLLLIGVDTDRAGVTGRSDTMVLAVFNTRQQTLKLVSFMRDMYVRIPGKGHSRLNAAYVYGGPDLLVKTINENFSVSIDGYLAVDFGLMAQLVDAIGGIDMVVLPEELKPLNGILQYYHFQRGMPEDAGLLQESGLVHLTGEQAMSYARIRKIDSDFVRVERQQKVLAVIYQKLLTLDPSVLHDCVKRFAMEVKTNVTLSEALDLSLKVLSVKQYEVGTLRIPIDKGSKSTIKNNAYILIPNLKKNIQAINLFLEIDP